MLLVATLVSGCSGDGTKSPVSADCGLPSPNRNADAAVVPDAFIPEDGALVDAQAERGGFLASINVPLGVGEALEVYREIVTAEGFEIIQIDNEGFEAEIYLRRKKELAAIQIRTSQCDDASIVFVNVVDADQLGGGLPSPSPSRRRG